MDITFEQLNMFIDGFSIFTILLIYISLILDKYRVTESRFFKSALVTGVVYCAVDFVYQKTDGNNDYIALNYILSFVGFVLGYAAIFFISGYLFDLTGIPRNHKLKMLFVYFIIGVLWVIGFAVLLFNGMVFTFKDGYYERCDGWIYSVSYPLVVLILDCILILFKKSDEGVRLFFAIFSIALTLSVVISYFFLGFSSLALVFVVSALMLYINVYVSKSRTVYKNNIELKERETESMISQIQPHFLYNCITSCVALCRIDPQRAALMMSDFGKYLRGNLDTFKQKAPIPFKQELEHIKVYLRLELVRFEDKLNIEYDIKSEDFFVPALSVQPIVENAVKHGIAASSAGGTVFISSYEDKHNFYVRVKDNGVGFDINKPKDSERSHIGIENVKKRMALVLDADVKIYSEIGKGTDVLITIPKNDTSVKGEIINAYSGSRR